MKLLNEKRRFPRLNQALPALIQANQLTPQNSTCRNISNGGACFEIDLNSVSEKVIWAIRSKEAKVNIEISLINGKDKIKARATVKWDKEISSPEAKRLNLGMEFSEIDDITKNRLASFIEENLREQTIKDEAERVPHDVKAGYTKDFTLKRREWLSSKTGEKFSHLAYFSSDPEEFRGNIENFVGVSQIPTGVMGPLVVRGDYANGVFYVPFATTEGALIETYQRGAIALAKSGGAKVFINKDANHLDPIFLFTNSGEARNFAGWINENFSKIKEKAESTTGFGKLMSATPYVVGRRVILDLAYYTSDAMGANMINMATEKVCNFIDKEIKIKGYLLRSNFSSEKKTSGVNILTGYGKEVIAEAVIPAKIIRRFLFSTAENIAKAWHSWALSSFSSGMLGINAHYANGLAAIFIACGQDVAHITNASVGITSYETTETGDLYVSLKLPNIIVGTLGGGTALATQQECLKMIGCYGKGKAKKFAEIIGASLLAGELGICAGITTKHFLDPHKRARAYTREKAYHEEKE